MRDVEKVRVLGSDPAPPPPRMHRSPPRWGLVATAIITSALFGYLAGAQRAIQQAPTAAIATSIVSAEHNPDPAVIGPADAGATEQALARAPTAGPETPSPRLRELIPGFTGSVQFNGVGIAGTWSANNPEPQFVSGVPRDVATVKFNSVANLAGYIDERGSLFAGSLSNPTLRAWRVESFMWHPVDSARLAWLGPREIGGTELWLMVTDISSDEPTPIAPLVAADGEVQWHVGGWGEWGFALYRQAVVDGEWIQETFVLDNEGEVQHHLVGDVVAATSVSGRIALHSFETGSRVMAAASESVAEFGSDLTVLKLSHGEALAAAVDADDVLLLVNLTTDEITDLGVAAEPLGFTDDDRFLVAIDLSKRDGRDGRDALVILNLETLDVFRPPLPIGTWPTGTR